MAGPILPGSPNPFSIPEGSSAEQESVFDPLYETLIKRAARVTGLDDPETVIQSFMNPMAAPAAMAAKLPMFKFGGKVLKNVGGKWQMLEEESAERALNTLKKHDPAQVIKGVDELSHITPPVRSREAPPLKGRWGLHSTQKKLENALSKGKFNTTDVKSIRERGRKDPKVISDLADEYGVSRTTISEIVNGTSWNWLK